MSEYNPFAAPDTYGDLAAENRPNREYGGIRRLPYFGIVFAVGIVGQLIQYAAVSAQSSALMLASIPIVWGGTVMAGGQRCKNLGANPWWGLGLLVPFLNIVVGLKCLACPEGYQDHKTLDGPGKVIVGLVVGCIVLAVLMLVFAVGMR